MAQGQAVWFFCAPGSQRRRVSVLEVGVWAAVGQHVQAHTRDAVWRGGDVAGRDCAAGDWCLDLTPPTPHPVQLHQPHALGVRHPRQARHRLGGRGVSVDAGVFG